MSQLQAAERDLRRAWRLDPTATRPLEELGDVHFELRNYARAADRYADYIAIDDRSPRLLYKLALARYRAVAAVSLTAATPTAAASYAEAFAVAATLAPRARVLVVGAHEMVS